MGDTRTRAIQRGKPHWTFGHWTFSQIEVWIIGRPASDAASQLGSEISSTADSEDDFSTVKQVISTKGPFVGDFEVHESIGVNSKMADSASTAMPAMSTAMPAMSTAMPAMIMAMPQTPGIIETIETSI